MAGPLGPPVVHVTNGKTQFPRPVEDASQTQQFLAPYTTFGHQQWLPFSSLRKHVSRLLD